MGDRVVVFTYRPAHIKAEFTTSHLPRPRHVEDANTMSLVREVTDRPTVMKYNWL